MPPQVTAAQVPVISTPTAAYAHHRLEQRGEDLMRPVRVHDLALLALAAFAQTMVENAQLCFRRR